MLGAGEDPSRVDWNAVHERQVAAGLRAQLALDNVITGTLFVALDYLPKTDIRLRGDGEVPEIPTVQSNMEQLVETLQEIPLKRVFEQAADLVAKLDELAGNDAKRALAAIEGSMSSVDTRVVEVADKLELFLDEGRELVAALEAQVGPLSNSTQGLLDEGRGLVNDVEGRLDQLAGVLEQVLEEARAVVRAVDARVTGLADRADATLGGELSSLLVELERSARSVRALAEALERRPEMLIGGKK
jgi:paraquat-inducible protein B